MTRFGIRPLDYHGVRRLVYANSSAFNWLNVNVESLTHFLKSPAVSFPHQFLIVDACAAPPQWKNAGIPTGDFAESWRPKEGQRASNYQFVLFSTREGDLASIQHSALFTSRLIRTIQQIRHRLQRDHSEGICWLPALREVATSLHAELYSRSQGLPQERQLLFPGMDDEDDLLDSASIRALPVFKCSGWNGEAILTPGGDFKRKREFVRRQPRERLGFWGETFRATGIVPPVFEYLWLRANTNPREWNDDERQAMRKSRRKCFVWCAAAVVIPLLMWFLVSALVYEIEAKRVVRELQAVSGVEGVRAISDGLAGKSGVRRQVVEWIQSELGTGPKHSEKKGPKDPVFRSKEPIDLSEYNQVAHYALAALAMGDWQPAEAYAVDGRFATVGIEILMGLEEVGVEPDEILRKIAHAISAEERDTDDSLMASKLMISLTRFNRERLAMISVDGRPICEWLSDVFRSDVDAGLHAASGLLWEHIALDAPQKQMNILEEETVKSEPVSKIEVGKSWYVNAQQQTMILLGPVKKFGMGEEDVKKVAQPRAAHHWRSIPRVYAISSTEVTVSEYREFCKEAGQQDEYGRPAMPPAYRNVPSDCAVGGITWDQAAFYCNWLSDRAALEECYEQRTGEQRIGNSVKQVFIAGCRGDIATRNGYRLPTEAEWEFACRAGSTSLCCFGRNPEWVYSYAYMPVPAPTRPQPVGRKRWPNAYGLFDVYGNVSEWCHADQAIYPPGHQESPLPDLVRQLSEDRRIHRGGGFSTRLSGPETPSSTARFELAVPTSPIPSKKGDVGFRVARTLQ